ncbi:hypothetical protein LOTGIDRAFT_235954 [Lottia gigantea]|uniref:Uncharacterized protein n=1 Tax=Lottia gigantea TaxID=225164 RepID=V4B8L0_LOTGI|nr:hypothetical protein LOTGIDRAFT_235954 [Lottia gigantea]ESO85094.1 hypothetical protein LOTGIDRAFT_235954 [Lottia gigantea]
MSVCPEFTQNAWRKELCANCQRPRGEHSSPVDLACTSKTSPKPTKRTSVILKSSVSSSVENGQTDLVNGNKSKQGLNILDNNSSNKPQLKSALSNSNRKNKSGKVVFDTSKAKVIGCDGGLDNLYDDNDNNDNDTSDSKPNFTFTNEEKKFAMLALENTIWNAEVTNLQINSDKKRYKAECREFEDVHLDLLSYFEPKRFSNLKDCDAIPVNSVNYGTFPVRKKHVDSKVKLDDYFNSQCKMSNDIEFNRIADTVENADSESSGSENYRHLPSSVNRVKSLTPSTNSSLSSDSDKSFNSDSSSKLTPGIDEIAVPYKIVSVITKKYSFSETKDSKDKSESYTMDDITECLYGTGEENCTPKKSANVMIKSFSEDRPVKKPAPNPKILKKSVSETPKHEEMDSASMEAVEMLNDVLACYSEGEDLRGSMSKKDKAKKSAFENNLATVAASLDLQKTKSKRPAPRPPSSPPPEPQVSPTRKLANKDEVEPVFKMVPLGKSIVSPPPPESPIPVSKSRNDSSSSLEEHFFNDNGDMSRSNTKSAENGKSKRGITSFFRSVFRRGKESPEPIEPLNPDITLMKAESRSDNSTPSTEMESVQEESKASPSMKRSSKFSPQPKFRVLPISSSQDNQSDSATASPSPSRKNDSTSSPKLKRDRVTFSPPTQHKTFANQELEEPKEPKTEASKPVAAPKPEISAKPTKAGEDVVIRRRAKSPKRTAPPVPPPKRTSIPNKTSNANNPDFAKELERRLSRPVDLNTIIEARRSITEKMGPPPSPPPKTCASPVEEEKESESPSPPEIQEESKSNDDILPVEKIELPTADRQGRKSFLGKLSKPKQRAPQPPSVKRAKSINDSTLPRIEKKNKGKKINVADISGPVMVTDVVNNKVLENRRNTISLGDEPAFTTAVTLESDCNMDNSFEDLPVISPLGSLENLYESILPKFGGRPHWYDPVKEDKTIKKPTASIPVEGYLEPVATQNPMISKTSVSTLNVSLPSTESLTTGTSSTNIMTTSMIVDHQFPPSLNHSGMSTSFCASSTLPRASKKTKKPNTNTLNKTIGGSIINIPPPPPPPVKEKKPVSNEPGNTTADEERRLLLASQPIYEEINGYYKLEEEDTKSVVSQISQLTNVPEADTLVVTENTTRSQSKETLSSESDTQSTCSTLSRPRPIPRRRPKRPDTGGSDQYVSMNRSNVAVTLGEERLRDVYSKLTGINLKALQDIYAQTEAILSTEKLSLLNPQMLKWVDFDVYGQPLHSSERCIVYNAKYKANNSPCQLMLLHSRPATEMSSTCHPSLLKPVAVFADTIPFVNLSEEFIKTSQVAQNSIYDTNLAKCFIAVGSFDIIETLDSHIALLRETLSHNLDALMHIILTLALQLLSAMSHCLDQGYTVTERDFRDVFLLTRADLRGKIIAFLPHQRSHDAHQGEAMCTFIDKLFKDVTADYLEFEEENETLLTIENMRLMLEPKRVDCLAQVRSVVEYLLWGPNKSDLLNDDKDSENSIEQELSIWLEKERAVGVARFAKNICGISNGIALDDYYRLKFLLKSSAVGLAESTRRLP